MLIIILVLAVILVIGGIGQFMDRHRHNTKYKKNRYWR